MAHSKTGLLTPAEHRDLYSIPVLDDHERQHYFTLTEQEQKTLRQFMDVKDAIYFAISLTFFKLKQTFISFQFTDVNAECQHVLHRYFPDETFSKVMPTESTKKRIHLKIMDLCQAKRLSGSTLITIQDELHALAPFSPRQRQLLKGALRLLKRHNVIIPGHTTLQNLVSQVWNREQKRILTAYQRHTTKQQRDLLLSLLDQPTDEKEHSIVGLKTDLKTFKTHALWDELAKHTQLKSIFTIAKEVIQALNLPYTTCAYYASLVEYYDRSQMKRLNTQSMGLYLLCYTFLRYQSTNDTLIDAFKKRVTEIEEKGNKQADEQRLKHLDESLFNRERISDMMITAYHHPDPMISKELLYRHIPKDQWEAAAYSLIDENFNKNRLFWHYVDRLADSIKLALRPLFLTLDFTIIQNDRLKEIVVYMKKHLDDRTFASHPFPAEFRTWIDKRQRIHVINRDGIIANRFEFLVYTKMIHALKKNQISLRYSLRHKNIDDELMQRKAWARARKQLLKKLNYPKLSNPMRQTLNDLNNELTPLYKTVNEAIQTGENESIIIKKNKKGEQVWSLKAIRSETEANEGFFMHLPQHGIVDTMKFVNQQTDFMKVFEPLLPKGVKTQLMIEYLSASVLANAVRMGAYRMSNSSDLNESTLLTTEANYLTVENLRQAVDHINNQTAKFEIFEQWYIDSILHGSLDGLKEELLFKHHKGRNSKKYFACGIGVAAYNHIVNGLSVTGKLIGAHEYEGWFSFEMVALQNTSEIKAKMISTDKHGTSPFNFALFDLIDLFYAPRIPKLHKEELWGFGKPEDYEGFLVKPTKFVDEQLLIDEADNIKRIIVSFLTGHVAPHIILRKMGEKAYTSKTKKALMQYNNLIKSRHILRTIHDPNYRHAVEKALNRGESYNNLYRAITLLNDGALRGKSEIEMEIWHQCTRLIAAIIHYHNTHILNTLYQRATSKEEKEFLRKLSPTAWSHVHLLGFFQFFSDEQKDWVEECINQWDWKKAAADVEDQQKKTKAQRRKTKKEKSEKGKEVMEADLFLSETDQP